MLPCLEMDTALSCGDVERREGIDISQTDRKLAKATTTITADLNSFVWYEARLGNQEMGKVSSFMSHCNLFNKKKMINIFKLLQIVTQSPFN